MKVTSYQNVSFKGTIYSTTDSHSYIPMLAGVLSEAEKRAKKSKDPSFFLDCGDILGEAMPASAVKDIFVATNKKIPTILNLGNVEIISHILDAFDVKKVLPELAESGITIVSLTMRDLLKRRNEDSSYIKPYTIIEDKIDGKPQRIMVTGFAETQFKTENYGVDDAKKHLKDDFLPYYKKEKPDKVIFLSHMMPNNTNSVLDYAKNDLGIKGIMLVIGGHPHIIADYEHGETRVLYSPPNGLGGYEIKNTKSGIVFDKIVPNENGFDYSPLKKSKSAIANIDTTEPLPLCEAYKQILLKPEYKKFNEVRGKVVFPLKYRNEYSEKITVPTEFGTFLANAYRDCTNADIGLFRSMDIRGSLPKVGANMTFYNVSTVLNTNKKINKIENVSVADLKEIFELSFQEQAQGIKNPDFLEYSDNVKIERYKNAKSDEPKISQIYVKNDEEIFEPLLDKDKNPIDDNRKFSVATCEFVADASKPAYKTFEKFDSEPYGNLSQKELFISYYKKIGKTGIKRFPAAIVVDI